MQPNPFATRTLIVLNPAAGQENPYFLKRQLGAAFAVRNAPFDLVETQGSGDAARFARDAAAVGYQAVVAVGGDGTIAETISGLAGTLLPLGIVPQGTGNQLANNLGIPLEVERAVEVALHGTAVPVDLGQVDHERYFALVAGAGWDAEVMSLATREMKDQWGFWAYLYAGLTKVLSPSRALFRITADGKQFRIHAATVMIANMGQFAAPIFPNEMRIGIGPSIRYDDGLLDVCIFAPRTVPDLAAMFWRVFRGQYSGDSRMLFLQARNVTVESDPLLYTQVDGDLVGRTPLRVRAVPGGVRVRVPG